MDLGGRVRAVIELKHVGPPDSRKAAAEGGPDDPEAAETPKATAKRGAAKIKRDAGLRAKAEKALQAALDQIEARGYAARYEGQVRDLIKVGVVVYDRNVVLVRFNPASGLTASSGQ